MTSINWDQFRAHVAAGFFELSWERPLPDGSSIGYGCLKSSGIGVPILMAGHGIYTNRETVRPETGLDHALVVGITALFEIRAARLRLRSPDVVARGPLRADALLMHDDIAIAVNVDLLVKISVLKRGARSTTSSAR